jgi:hypothetical protein
MPFDVEKLSATKQWISSFSGEPYLTIAIPAKCFEDRIPVYAFIPASKSGLPIFIQPASRIGLLNDRPGLSWPELRNLLSDSLQIRDCEKE